MKIQVRKLISVHQNRFGFRVLLHGNPKSGLNTSNGTLGAKTATAN